MAAEVQMGPHQYHSDFLILSFLLLGPKNRTYDTRRRPKQICIFVFFIFSFSFRYCKQEQAMILCARIFGSNIQK